MARKRSSGEGSLHYWAEKDYWVGRLLMPDGKRKAKYNKSQKVVKDWLLSERGKLSQGIYIPDDKVTVEFFLKRYLEDYGKHSLRVTTFEGYKAVIERHIVPEIGNLRLSTLRADQLNHLYRKKLEAGLSDRSVEYIHGILRRSLNKAVKWGLLTKNPTDNASPPTVKFKQPTVWTGEQVKAFLESVKDHRWAGIFYLACGVGMRKGEVLGLPLTALDLEQGYLKVIQTLQFVSGQGLLKLEPKTDRSRRMIVLPGFVVKALKIHMARRSILSQNPNWKESGLVFTTDTGTPIAPTNMLRLFKDKVKSAELPKIRFHDLRHTTASLLLEKNLNPKFVSELLGHSSVNLTLNTYSHIINPMNRVTADTMDEIVSPK